jgi:2-oxoglutarate dehydrogenase E2 component (dihydrolipoamide succinyltransferase)
MIHEIIIPKTSPNDTEVDLTKWYVQHAQKVALGDHLADLETSKATVGIFAEADGYIEIIAAAPRKLMVGAIAARIAPEPVAHNSTVQKAPSKIHQEIEPKIPISLNFDRPRYEETRFSLAALAKLHELGIDQSQFAGAGLVTVNNLLGEKNSSKKYKDVGPGISGIIGSRALSSDAQRLVAAKVRSSEKISRAKQVEIELLTAGQLSLVNSSLTVSLSTAEIRRFLAENAPHLGGQLLPVIVYEVAQLLKDYKEFNSYFDENQIHYYEGINIGVAVDVGSGLKVPVIRQADRLLPAEISTYITSAAIKSIGKQLEVSDLEGGSFTITDLSSANITSFQPLLNARQAMILGIGADEALPGLPLTITAKFDHRISTGRRVADFLNDLRDRLLSYGSSSQGASGTTIPQSCKVCLIDVKSLYREYQKEARMHLCVEVDGSMSAVCHICSMGY